MCNVTISNRNDFTWQVIVMSQHAVSQMCEQKAFESWISSPGHQEQMIIIDSCQRETHERIHPPMSHQIWP